MSKLLSRIIAALLGLWLAATFVKGVKIEAFPDSNFFGVPLNQQWQIYLVLGIILGLLNLFVKPIIKIISFPLRIITFGFFSLVINIGIIWLLDIIFKEFTAPWFWPLLWTTIIVWFLNLIIVGGTKEY